MSPLKSQLLGILLAFSTAIGLIYYEKIVQSFSYLTFLIILLIQVLGLCLVSYFLLPHKIDNDCRIFFSAQKYSYWAIIYIISGVTSIIWYKIAREQGVMVGSIYEIKYIVVLALIYFFLGSNKFTINTFLGLCFAICSIYFISKK